MPTRARFSFPGFSGCLILLAALFALISALVAQPATPAPPTASDANSGTQLTHDPTHPTHPYALRWWGRAGVYYFVEQSQDLNAAWSDFPFATLGTDAVAGVDIATIAPALFLRLVSTADPGSPLLTVDYDGDQVNNGDELRFGTDPFSNVSNDGDTLPDDWERWHFGHLDQSAESDADGDFVYDYDEFFLRTDPTVAAADATVALTPPPGRHVGYQTLRLASAHPQAIVRYTTDGLDPTADSPAFYPFAQLETASNIHLRLKTKIFFLDGASGPVETHLYEIAPVATASQMVYYGKRLQVPAAHSYVYTYTHDPDELALSTVHVNFGRGRSRLTLGPGWLSAVDGAVTFTPDLSVAPQTLYYGSVMVPSGFNQSEALVGFSTTSADFLHIPQANYRNYRTQGTGWLKNWDDMMPHIDRAAPQSVFYELVDFSPVTVHPPRWLYTDAGVNPHWSYAVGPGWVSGPGAFQPDTRVPSSTIYHGQVAGFNNHLTLIYSSDLSAFSRTGSSPRFYRYVPLSKGWSLGHAGMLPDKTASPVPLFYGVARKGGWEGPLYPVISSSIAHLEGSGYAPGFHKYMSLGAGYTLAVDVFEPSFRTPPQGIHTGGNALYPQAPGHAGPFMAISAAALSAAPGTVGGQHVPLGTGWLTRSETAGAKFLPYLDDDDELTFVEEISLGTDPFSNDSDGDGILDGPEVYPLGGGTPSNPRKRDSDGDGILDGIDTHPTDPSDGADAFVPLDRPILKVDASDSRLIHHGFRPFGSSEPTIRYLTKETERAYTYTGDNPEHAPESSLDETLTSTIDRLNGLQTDEREGTENNNTPIIQSSTVTSATVRQSTTTLAQPYDDDPNEKDDGPVTGTQNEQLSAPYTRAEMVAHARSHYAAWPGEFAGRSPVAFWRLTVPEPSSNPAESDSPSIHLRRIRYKFSWRDIPANHESKTIRWLVSFTAPQDPNAPLGTPPVVPSYRGYTWTGTELEHLAPEIVPDKPGTWEVLTYDDALQVDVDRNGTIGSTETTTEELSYLTTINDNDHNPGETFQADYLNNTVDGPDDLADFFPVFLDIKQLLTLLPPSASGAPATGKIVYKLKHAEGKLNFVYTSLTRATAFGYQNGASATTGYGPNQNAAAHEAPTHQITATGIDIFKLDPDLATRIENNGQGVILVEMRGMTAAPLKLVVEKDYVQIAEVVLNIATGEAKFEAIPGNAPLSDNKNMGTGDWMPGKGKRIFPDARNDTDTVPRNRIYAKVGLAGVAGTVTLRIVDVDDPSPSATELDPDYDHLVDPNDAAGERGGDNTGDLGNGLSAVFAINNLSELTCTVGADGYARVNGQFPVVNVSMRPGDNYRLAVAQASQGVGILQTIDPVGVGYVPAGADQPKQFNGVCSEMLTVWRKLHVEQDTMRSVAATGSQKNHETASIDSINPISSHPGRFLINLDTNLPGGDGRFQNGDLTIGSTVFQVIESKNNLFTGTDVTVGDNSIGSLALRHSSGLLGSITIRDDDGKNGLPEAELPILVTEDFIDSYVVRQYGRAYIEPDSTQPNPDRELDFILNTRPPYPGNGSRNLNDRPDFWAVRIVAAFQCLEGEDGDPDTGQAEKLTTGEYSGGDVYIFMEGIREHVRGFMSTPPSSIGRTLYLFNRGANVAHEMAHAPNPGGENDGNDDHAEGSLMADPTIDEFANEDVFTSRTISRLRRTIKWCD